MSESVIAALITSGVSLTGTIITVLVSGHRTSAKMQTSQAVTESKLESLTREVREHNDFARRMPVLEEKIRGIQHRIRELESEHKNGGAYCEESKSLDTGGGDPRR